MKMKIRFLLIPLLALTACTSADKNKMAEALYQKAQQEYQMGQYDDAIADLDSLKLHYAKQIEQREKGIKLRQDVLLKKAQGDLAKTDSALQAEIRHFSLVSAKAEKDKNAGIATAAELTDVTLTRMKRDSLQVRFDVLCGQIRYIHRKQKEN